MKQLYQAPELTVVKFRAECGFAVSSTPLDAMKFWEWEPGVPVENQNHMESYTTANEWNEGSNTFWN